MSELTPQDGDVVIRRERRDAGWAFVLRTLPGPDQYTLPGQGAAVDAAIHVAMRERVCVWIVDANGSSTLLNDFRLDAANADVASPSSMGHQRAH